MQMDYFILIAMWIIGIIGFIVFIPRKEKRKGILVFMIFQAIIWLCDMFSFSNNLLSAPVRFFPKATDLTVTINYLFYPMLFSLYYVHRKANGSLKYRITYFLIWVSSVTLFDMLIERHTNLLEYDRITSFGMWVYNGFIFFMSQMCCSWFYRGRK